MPDPQKSEVRPDAPEQKKPDTFCRDCVMYAQKWGYAGICMVDGMIVYQTSPACEVYQRRGL